MSKSVRITVLSSKEKPHFEEYTDAVAMAHQLSQLLKNGWEFKMSIIDSEQELLHHNPRI